MYFDIYIFFSIMASVTLQNLITLSYISVALTHLEVNWTES